MTTEEAKTMDESFEIMINGPIFKEKLTQMGWTPPKGNMEITLEECEAPGNIEGDLSPIGMRELNKIKGYHTSRDYRQLVFLMRSQSVICFVDYKDSIRDLAKTMFQFNSNPDFYAWQIVNRGIVYIYASNIGDFIRECEILNVEFIVPDLEMGKDKQ